MKRRSARPFTVEIKHTRTSRALLSDATERSRRGQDLWRDLPVAAADKAVGTQQVEPGPVARSEPVQPAATARRVLPSLVPMFAMPIEPEASDVRHAPEVERLPRARRPKPTAQRKQLAAVPVTARQPAAEPMLPSHGTPVTAAPASAKASSFGNQSASPQRRIARRTQRTVTLRPGERWKRRLPRMLW